MVRRVEENFGWSSAGEQRGHRGSEPVSGADGGAVARVLLCERGRRFYASWLVLPHMLHEHTGHCIVNISSIWGQRGASREVAYSATAALIGLTRSWRQSCPQPHPG